EEGTVTEFDKTKIITLLNTVINSLQIN
ncbi:MAG: hypothetical protein QG665_353, partial [Patescibacteria group bacterium]|nr:hypothetical protein [Patescibacteria group bacterium]